MRQVNVIRQVYLNNYVKASVNGSGETRSLESAAGVINIPSVYSLGAQPYPWDFSNGDKMLIDPACLSGFGATPLPVELISDGANLLYIKAEQDIYSGYGSYATPIATIPAQNPAVETVFFGSNGFFKIPYKLMYLGMGIRVRAHFWKNDADATATQFRARFGNSAVSAGGDKIVFQTSSAAAGSEIIFDRTVRITKLGASGTAMFTTKGFAKLFTSATATADDAGDRNTLFTTAADSYITLSVLPPNITATFALIDFSISLVP